jgi:hypothetical protein
LLNALFKALCQATFPATANCGAFRGTQTVSSGLDSQGLSNTHTHTQFLHDFFIEILI